MKRLLVTGAHEGAVTISGPRAHHLVRVLRARVGDTLEVFDGQGTSFDATVEQVADDSAVLSLGPARVTPTLRQIIVVQGLPKGDKFELVLQKGTELGAAAFVTAACERSVSKIDGRDVGKLARWQRIVEEAARQCHRADVPTVSLPVPVREVSAKLPASTTVLVLDEEERETSLSAAYSQLSRTQPVALVVGPEGGLTRAEVETLRSQGATGVSLGRLILRTETAALASLAVLRHLDGDFA